MSALQGWAHQWVPGGTESEYSGWSSSRHASSIPQTLPRLSSMSWIYVLGIQLMRRVASVVGLTLFRLVPFESRQQIDDQGTQ